MICMQIMDIQRVLCASGGWGKLPQIPVYGGAQPSFRPGEAAKGEVNPPEVWRRGRWRRW
jgi:hypothetical protein